MALRSPIVSVLGHVDHGKSSILDAIRGSNILATEPGAITQAIGASIIPAHVIEKKCGQLLEAMKLKLTIPGLLFIDTPGHAAFTSLRKRGGALADIAIVVVDVNEGFKPQTEETIEILRQSKTPFLVAANKIDIIPGYRMQAEGILADVKAQQQAWIQEFEKRMYGLVGEFHEKFGMQAERFDRVEDFTKQIALVPTSAKNNRGIRELLMVLAGLAQRFLEKNLALNVEGPGKGTILEVKETQGFGATIDVILYDGVIRRNDTIVIGDIDEPIVTRVRALLEPNPLQEMRDKKSKYRNLPEATAATGLKIAAPDLDRAVAGMPLRVARGEDDAILITEELKREVKESMIQTDKEGIIIKADTLGSLEALSVLLHEKGITFRKATVGAISKKDIADAESNLEQDPAQAVILGFNIPEEPSTERVKIFTSDVIYKLVDLLEEWQDRLRKEEEAKQLEQMAKPCKLQILENCIFRQSNPCVMGVEILRGTLQQDAHLMKRNGDYLAPVKSVQRASQSIDEARFGEQVAISLPGVTGGRQVKENDVLYSALQEDQFRKLKELAKFLKPDEKEALKEIAEIMRKKNPVWGV